METINNNQMSEFTTHHKQFTNNTGSVYTTDQVHPDLYIVYSYGEHFPMYVYDDSVGMWFDNEDRYSPTTAKHQTLARPDTDDMTALPTTALLDLIAVGGYRAYCAERCVNMHFGVRH